MYHADQVTLVSVSRRLIQTLSQSAILYHPMKVSMDLYSNVIRWLYERVEGCIQAGERYTLLICII